MADKNKMACIEQLAYQTYHQSLFGIPPVKHFIDHLFSIEITNKVRQIVCFAPFHAVRFQKTLYFTLLSGKLQTKSRVVESPKDCFYLQTFQNDFNRTFKRLAIFMVIAKSVINNSFSGWRTVWMMTVLKNPYF